jgi:hypothetical protein
VEFLFRLFSPHIVWISPDKPPWDFLHSPDGIPWRFRATGIPDASRFRAGTVPIPWKGRLGAVKMKTLTGAGYAQGSSEETSSNRQGVLPVPSGKGEVSDNIKADNVQLSKRHYGAPRDCLLKTV